MLKHKRALMGLAVILPALALFGCTSVDSLSKEGEDQQGLSPEEMEALDAESHGVGDSGGLQGRALGSGGSGDLNDPNSPLSTRVIYFEYDSDEVKEEYRAAVEAHVAYLTSHPDTVMTLEGHADERGSREYNLALGERRAMALRRQMGVLGASTGQIRTVSFGEERPAMDGHDESAFSMNRRVEIVY
jgi:peptidoglycan-associated lipoprotein